VQSKGYIKNLFISNRFFLGMGIVIFLFVIAFYIPLCWHLAWISLFTLAGLTLLDYVLLFFTKHKIEVQRTVSEKLSNGDANQVHLQISNKGNFQTSIQVIDELPKQLQAGDFLVEYTLKGYSQIEHVYTITPKERGAYQFGNILVYAQSPIGLLSRKHFIETSFDTKVYPSYLQLKKQTLYAFSYDQTYGESRHKRIASSLEFDHIKEYVRGDDVRTINWKATARKNQLMVNTFIDERSQNIYLVLDMGRTMYYPFDGMSLLDYAINSALMLSYTILHKNDKVGLLSFNTRLNSLEPPSKNKKQIHKITELLYKQETSYKESDYEVLSNVIRYKGGQRSFILLYTNFETIHALQRHMPYLKNIASRHLLCVVIFENKELSTIHDNYKETLEGLYVKTIADKFVYEKKRIVKELNKQGIHTIYTTPQNLSVDALNKYLELKEKRLL
jgi:uncharacterized protein (DUF58 family)